MIFFGSIVRYYITSTRLGLLRASLEKETGGGDET